VLFHSEDTLSQWGKHGKLFSEHKVSYSEQNDQQIQFRFYL